MKYCAFHLVHPWKLCLKVPLYQPPAFPTQGAAGGSGGWRLSQQEERKKEVGGMLAMFSGENITAKLDLQPDESRLM